MVVNDSDNSTPGAVDDCPLCQSWDRLGLAAWNLWDPGETSAVARGQRPGGSWTTEIAALLADDPEDFPELSAQQIADHFYRHQPPQPAARKGVARGQAIYGLQALGDHLEDVVTAVFRLHKMTTEQITAAFYPNKSVYQVDQLLSYAAQAHYLYRHFVVEEEIQKRTGLVDVLGQRPTKKSTVWYLGRAGAVYVQEKLGLDYNVSYTRDRQSTASTTLAHDLKAARVGIALSQALRQENSQPADGNQPRVAFNHKNWLGPTTQGLIMGYWHRPEIRWAQIMPDGMLGIDVQQSAYGSGGTVLFLEYDHGSKEHREIVDQLLAYNALAESEAVAARFPQLSEWSVPMLMVFSSRQRMESIVNKFRSEIAEIRPYTPLWFVAEEDWLADPLAAIIGNFWAPGGKEKLIPSWLAVSEPVINRLAPQQLLEINQRGAPVRNEKGQKYNSAIHNQNITESSTNTPPSDIPVDPQPNVDQQAMVQAENDQPPAPGGGARLPAPPEHPEQQPVADNNNQNAAPHQPQQAEADDKQSVDAPAAPESAADDDSSPPKEQSDDPQERKRQRAKEKEQRKKRKKKALVKPAPQVAAAQRWSQQLVAAYQHLADLQAEGEKLMSPPALADLPPVAGDLQPPVAEQSPEQNPEQPSVEPQVVEQQNAGNHSPPPLPGETELPPPVIDQPLVAPAPQTEQQPSQPVVSADPFPPLNPETTPAVSANHQPSDSEPSAESDFPELPTKKTPSQQPAASPQPPVTAQQQPATQQPPVVSPSPPELVDDHPGAAPQAAPGEDIEELLSRQADQARRQQ